MPGRFNAVSRLAAAGDDLSVSVARAARVHRSFIYRHGDLHAAVHDQAARDTTPFDGTRASRQALQADLANALERSTRQIQRISRLEKKLSHVLGENALEGKRSRCAARNANREFMAQLNHRENRSCSSQLTDGVIITSASRTIS